VSLTVRSTSDSTSTPAAAAGGASADAAAGDPDARSWPADTVGSYTRACTRKTSRRGKSMSNPAESYESYMVPTLFAPWASRLVESANPQAGERVLDLACGTGIVARSVASRVGSNGTVIGLDLNPHMLAVARVAAVREGLTIDLREGRAEELPFPDGHFDRVLCQFALMFFTDQHAALTEMRRVLTTRGQVWLSVWQGLDRHPFYQTLHEVIEQRLGMSALQDIFALGDADELRRLMTDAGLRQVEIEPASMTARFPNPAGFLAGEIDVDTAAIPSMQHLDARGRQAIVAAISEEMAAPLSEVTQNDHVVIPFHALIAHGRR
jgi:ubiquinone/menaquinone biosynthesis C-methylase UbiE